MVEDDLRFDGEVSIVTGAGNGLGRGYALALGARGAAVVCNDIVADAARTTAEEIVQGGGRAIAETSSVASREGGEAIVSAAVDTFGSVDIVVNNAGQLRNAAFESMTVEDFDDVVRTHLAGSFYVTQPAYRHMKRTGYGRIVFTSSDAALGVDWSANYSSAKAGLVGLCKVVALEGAAHGIVANAIWPMALGTTMGDEGRPPYSPEGLDEMMQAIGPVARYMTVDHVTPFVTYLVSRACTLTGRIFAVGCGRVAEVVVGTGPGFFASDLARLTPEEIAANLHAVCDVSNFIPLSAGLDQFRVVASHLPPRAPA